jgi:hypothetical protein
VGQSRHVYARFRFYRYDKRKGTQPKLDNSFFKYGVLAHEFQLTHWLPQNIEQHRLDHYEQIYMDSYRKRGCRLLNTREAGAKGRTSEETKQKFREKRMGHPVSQETRKKISEANTGKKHGPLHAERSGAFWRGRKRGPQSPAHTAKVAAKNKGRIPWNKGKTGIYSDETLDRIRAARAQQAKIVYTDEVRERMRQAAKKRGISSETRKKINETKRRKVGCHA